AAEDGRRTARAAPERETLRQGMRRGAVPRHAVAPAGPGRTAGGPGASRGGRRPEAGPPGRCLGLDEHPRIHPQPLTQPGETFMEISRTNCERSSRRDFLSVGAAGLLGLSLADVLRAEARTAPKRKRKADSVILLWLGGGPSTIDTWDLKPDAPENV